MTDSSRAQGGLICLAVVTLGALFLAGLVAESYWAVALPVAVGVAFVLGLAFWVGWTIATVRVEPEPSLEDEPEPPAASDAGGSADASGL
jgi:hypothetical protein